MEIKYIGINIRFVMKKSLTKQFYFIPLIDRLCMNFKIATFL